MAARTGIPTRDKDPLSAPLGYAMAPMHKRAFGIAVGTMAGALLFLLTVFHVVVNPSNALDIGLLAEYFYGYSVSWRGAFVGLAWGLATGFIAGWFVAFVRNLVVTVTIFAIRTRAELEQTRDFLDHI
jgi:hypothetical protein